MGYYIRLLTPSLAVPSLGQLQDDFAELGVEGISLAVEAADESDTAPWSYVRLFNGEGYAVCDLSRDVLGADELVKEELEDFRGELTEARPKSAARWVRERLDEVKAIYAVQVLEAADDDEALDLPNMLLALLQGYLGGIIQADGEGFSNEDGHLVISQHDEDAEGVWTAAVLEPDGGWTTFLLDLGDPEHRAAFAEGRIPEGAERLADEDEETAQ